MRFSLGKWVGQKFYIDRLQVEFASQIGLIDKEVNIRAAVFYNLEGRILR